MTIAKKLKKAREEKGLTQKQLADKCGIVDSAIRKYESGKINPKPDALRKLAEALDISAMELLYLPTDDTQDSYSTDESPLNTQQVDRNSFSYLMQLHHITSEYLKKSEQSGDSSQIFAPMRDIHNFAETRMEEYRPECAEDIENAIHKLNIEMSNGIFSGELMRPKVTISTSKKETEYLTKIIDYIYKMIDEAILDFKAEYPTDAPDAKELLNAYEKLNEKGKQLAVERLLELAQIPAYAVPIEKENGDINHI